MEAANVVPLLMPRIEVEFFNAVGKSSHKVMFSGMDAATDHIDRWIWVTHGKATVSPINLGVKLKQVG